jgi:hypothetical protein
MPDVAAVEVILKIKFPDSSNLISGGEPAA